MQVSGAQSLFLHYPFYHTYFDFVFVDFFNFSCGAQEAQEAHLVILAQLGQ